MTIPNMLTGLRLSLIPIFVLAFYLPFGFHRWVLVGIFVFASLTDWLDGYLARKLKQVSPLGTFLDPVADKLLVSVALMLLVEVYATPFLTIPALVIVGREIVVSALREWMAELGKRGQVSVSRLGKYKTALQMLSIILFLYLDPRSRGLLHFLTYGLMYACMVLTLWSMVCYLRAAWREMA